MSAHTPGPWRWEFNQTTKSIQLCGGKPAHDMTVMCFARVGMNGATPLVLDPADPCVLVPASRFAQPQAGREHHKPWFQILRQPDLDMIAAAPDMYDALTECICGLEVGLDAAQIVSTLGDGRCAAIRSALTQARAALAKAGGQ